MHCISRANSLYSAFIKSEHLNTHFIWHVPGHNFAFTTQCFHYNKAPKIVLCNSHSLIPYAWNCILSLFIFFPDWFLFNNSTRKVISPQGFSSTESSLLYFLAFSLSLLLSYSFALCVYLGGEKRAYLGM
jgi:hypothetical protein